MDYNTPDVNSWQTKLVTRVGRTFRSNRSLSETALRKDEAKALERHKKAAERHAKKYNWTRRESEPISTDGEVNELGERDYASFSQASTLINNVDNTDMLHGLAHRDSFDSLLDHAMAVRLKEAGLDTSEAMQILDELHTRQFAALPDEVWQLIISYISLADTISLAMASKVLHQKVGQEPFILLRQPDNRYQRITFLHHLDHEFPRHLLCFPCGRFHLRSKAGKESLKMDYVGNPLFDCPSTRATYLPRMRLVHGRELPYTFINLALRGNRFSVAHGIAIDALARRWKCKDTEWTHRTRYLINNGHFLMRVVSQAFALPSAEMTETRERHMLYDREEYIPFFSVCAHWRDGDLMKLCKCMLSHVPAPPKSIAAQLREAPKFDRELSRPNFIVRGCDFCRPARRCPECPTEYLIEIQMVEDKNDPIRRFKHALVVTRWSDLGDGSSPYASPEWLAVNGMTSEDTGNAYESFSLIGRRAVGGIFESKVSGSVPGQRLISLNPKNEKLGQDGHGWY